MDSHQMIGDGFPPGDPTMDHPIRSSGRPQMKKLAADHTFFSVKMLKNVLNTALTEHVTGPPAPNSSKKYGPRIKDVENPHHTVSFGECSGTCKMECGLSDSQIR
ncbi:hypothetical protein TNCV_2795181 [Trichonephila clavipes]|nr:hypothetical protein TNCV_2795181 [Trichonephila clavipes]